MLTDSSRVILISLKPRFARAILEGDKRYELRRYVPRFNPDDRMLIYASSPERRVLGTCRVCRVFGGAAMAVWEAIGAEASGISASTFFGYLGQRERCAAIQLAEPRSFAPPFALPLRPPQTYFFLDPDNPRHREILRLTAATPARSA